jgi:ABC-type multidrug transport system permease subunit
VAELKKVHDLLIIAWINFLPNARTPPVFISPFVVALIPLIFFVVFGEGITEDAFVGVLVTMVSFVGIAIATDVVEKKIIFKFQEMLVASPVSPFSYAFGISFSALIFNLPGISIFLSLLYLKGSVTAHSFLIIVGALVCSWAAISMLGFTIATYMVTSQSVAPLVALLGALIGYLPPVYYRLSRLPQFFQWVSYLVPTTHTAQIMRNAMNLIELDRGAVLFHWAALAAFGVLFAILTISRAQWRES